MIAPNVYDRSYIKLWGDSLGLTKESKKMTRRGGARTDSNHTPIVQSLKSLGYSVQDLSQVGGGCPDILVGVLMKHGSVFIPINLVFEIKASEEIAKKVKSKINTFIVLPKDSVQIKWHKLWRGQKAVVGSLTEILRIIKSYERGVA